MYNLILHNKHKPHLTDTRLKTDDNKKNSGELTLWPDLFFFFIYINTLLYVNKALMITQSRKEK